MPKDIRCGWRGERLILAIIIRSIADVLEQVLEKLRRDRHLPVVGIPQNLPYSGVIQFVGRQAELERLHQQLQPGSPVAISAVSGMGGIGKTELALEYARQRCRAEAYPGGICWLRVREDVGSQIISFARSLLDLTPPDDLELAEKVRWCWGRWREGAALLILDDVQDYAEVRSLLPPPESRFKVLMTTRSHFGSPVQELQLNVLSEAEALELLRVLVQDDRIDQEIDRAKQLCDWLGYLPLGDRASRTLFGEEAGFIDRGVAATITEKTAGCDRL